MRLCVLEIKYRLWLIYSHIYSSHHNVKGPNSVGSKLDKFVVCNHQGWISQNIQLHV